MIECIVKIQRPLSDNTAPWLVYDQARKVHALIPRRQLPSAVVTDMGRKPKIYYHAVLEPGLRFIRVAADQSW